MSPRSLLLLAAFSGLSGASRSAQVPDPLGDPASFAEVVLTGEHPASRRALAVALAAGTDGGGIDLARRLLVADDWRLRLDAVRILASSRAKGGEDVLLALAGRGPGGADRVMAVRRGIALALGLRGTERSIPMLRELAGDVSAVVRSEAAVAALRLVLRGGGGAREVLRGRVSDSDSGTADLAARCLAVVATPEDSAVLGAVFAEPRRGIRERERCGAAILALGDRRGLEDLPSLPEGDPLDSLRRALLRRAGGVRASLSVLLRDLRGRCAPELAHALLGEIVGLRPSPEEFVEAWGGLPAGLTSLARALAAVPENGPPSRLQAVCAAAAQDAPGEALIALAAEIGDSRLAESLAGVVFGDDASAAGSRLRLRALEAAWRIAGSSRRDLAERALRSGEAVLMAFVARRAAGTDLEPLVLDVIGRADADPAVVDAAFQAFGESGTPASAAALRAALRSGSSARAEAALRALASRKDGESLRVLHEQAAAPPPAVRIGSMVAALRRRDPAGARDLALRHISSAGPDDVPGCLSALDRRDASTVAGILAGRVRDRGIDGSGLAAPLGFLAGLGGGPPLPDLLRQILETAEDPSAALDVIQRLRVADLAAAVARRVAASYGGESDLPAIETLAGVAGIVDLPLLAAMLERRGDRAGVLEALNRDPAPSVRALLAPGAARLAEAAERAVSAKGIGGEDDVAFTVALARVLRDLGSAGEALLARVAFEAALRLSVAESEAAYQDRRTRSERDVLLEGFFAVLSDLESHRLRGLVTAGWREMVRSGLAGAFPADALRSVIARVSEGGPGGPLPLFVKACLAGPVDGEDLDVLLPLVPPLLVTAPGLAADIAGHALCRIATAPEAEVTGILRRADPDPRALLVPGLRLARATGRVLAASGAGERESALLELRDLLASGVVDLDAVSLLAEAAQADPGLRGPLDTALGALRSRTGDSPPVRMLVAIFDDRYGSGEAAARVAAALAVTDPSNLPGSLCWLAARCLSAGGLREPAAACLEATLVRHPWRRALIPAEPDFRISGVRRESTVIGP